jgi:hypothetical protein
VESLIEVAMTVTVCAELKFAGATYSSGTPLALMDSVIPPQVFPPAGQATFQLTP